MFFKNLILPERAEAGRGPRVRFAEKDVPDCQLRQPALQALCGGAEPPSKGRLRGDQASRPRGLGPDPHPAQAVSPTGPCTPAAPSPPEVSRVKLRDSKGSGVSTGTGEQPPSLDTPEQLASPRAGALAEAAFSHFETQMHSPEHGEAT